MARGATVLVGTPGRLADVVARTRGNTAALDLRRLEVLASHVGCLFDVLRIYVLSYQSCSHRSQLRT